MYPIYHAVLLLKEIFGITAGFIESVETDSTHARDCPVSQFPAFGTGKIDLPDTNPVFEDAMPLVFF
ncbi:hypothetical protein NIB75_06440 [Bacteroides uniformis]|nr:hypothetical protein [Bacteroides uniformis]